MIVVILRTADRLTYRLASATFERRSVAGHQSSLSGGILPASRALEIVAFAVEVLLAEQSPGLQVEVQFDLRVPDPASGSLRQVDVGVTALAGGRVFQRIIEVSDRRSKKIDSPYVDGVIGKAMALGVHRASIVSTGGFTRPALLKVVRSGSLLDAIYLRPAAPHESAIAWRSRTVIFPTRQPDALRQEAAARGVSVDLDLVVGTAAFPLTPLVYEDAVGNRPLLMIAYTRIVLDGCYGIMTVAEPLAEQVRPGFRAAVIPRLFLDEGEFRGEYAIGLEGEDGKDYTIGIPSADIWHSVGASLERSGSVGREDAWNHGVVPDATEAATSDEDLRISLEEIARLDSVAEIVRLAATVDEGEEPTETSEAALRAAEAELQQFQTNDAVADARRHDLLGAVYLQLGQIERAIDHLAASVGRFPAVGMSRANLGIAYFRFGDLRRAVEEWRIAFGLGFESCDLRLRTAVTLGEMKLTVQAIEAYAQFVAICPDHPQASGVRGMLERLKGMSSE